MHSLTNIKAWTNLRIDTLFTFLVNNIVVCLFHFSFFLFFKFFFPYYSAVYIHFSSLVFHGILLQIAFKYMLYMIYAIWYTIWYMIYASTWWLHNWSAMGNSLLPTLSNTSPPPRQAPNVREHTAYLSPSPF